MKKIRYLMPIIGITSLISALPSVSSCTKTQPLSQVKYFIDTDWKDIIAYIEEFEASSKDEAAMKKLCNHFLDTPYKEDMPWYIQKPNEQIEQHLSYFLGKENYVTINNKKHKVKVIGIEHDLLENETNKYATFTFELMNPVTSDTSTEPLIVPWNDIDSPRYTNSVLRATLTGEGGATSFWSGGRVTALSLLYDGVPVLKNKIKTVQKMVCLLDGSSEQYTTTLFPLSVTEMALHTLSGEGKPYRYWSDGASRVKRTIYGLDLSYYWTTSMSGLGPGYIGGSGNVVWAEKIFDYRDVTFAFCI